MKTYLLAFSILLSTQLIATNTAKAEDGNDLYNLCSKFPYNSKCEGYEAPIALKDRLGEDAQCLITGQEEAENCKVNLQDESVTFYLETGEGLDILEDQKDTQEIVIPLTAIESFTYSERKRIDTGAVLAFGVWGLLSKKKTATFNLNLEPTQEEDENSLPKQAAFITKRSTGQQIRQSLEEKTNLEADVLDLGIE